LTVVIFRSPSKLLKGEDMDHFEFPKTGFVRLKQILAPIGPIPVSKSTWWQGVKDGRFPQSHKLGPRTTVWRAEDIRKIYELEESNS